MSQLRDETGKPLTTGDALFDATGKPVSSLNASLFTFRGCSLYSNANLTVSTATLTSVPWALERYDTDGFHSTSSNTSRITIPIDLDGYYLFGGGVVWLAGATNTRSASLYLNGATLFQGNAELAVTAVDFDQSISGMPPQRLVGGDYVEVVLYQDSGANRTAGLNTYPSRCGFWCVWLGT